MPSGPDVIDWEWQEETHRLFSTWRGDVTLDAILAFLSGASWLEDVHTDGFDRLHDLRQMAKLSLDFNSVMHVAANRRSYLSSTPGGFRVAFVATQEAHIGMVRMYQRILDGSGAVVQCFGTMEAAEAWLATPRESTARASQDAGNSAGPPLQ